MLYPLELRARTQFDCTLRLPPVKPDYLAALYYPPGREAVSVSSSSSRLAYIDWMRGLACVLMFQTHCYDSWLAAGAGRTPFFRGCHWEGRCPPRWFLFLRGFWSALFANSLRKNVLAPFKI